MNVRELRIGNSIDYNGNVLKVDAVNQTGIYVDFKESFLNNDEFNPIPLTEEWILKFGFENLEKEAENDGGLIELIYNDTIGYRFAPEGAYGHPEIKYVHQLQNLYFSLTGEELTPQ